MGGARLRWFLLVVAAATSATFARESRADTKACSNAAEDGQRLRAAGQFRRARHEFTLCSTEECPALIRQDCQGWSAGLLESMPSIIVDAKDANDHDLADVIVKMDDIVLTRTLDGKALDVDPGPHTFVFEHAGDPPVVEKVIIKERARGRTFVMKFGAVAPTDAVAPVTPLEPARGHTIPPWILIGVGATFLVTGVVLLATAPSLPDGCDASSQVCVRRPTDTTQDLQDRQTVAGNAKSQPLYGAIFVAAGGTIAVGGILWHFLERTGPVHNTSIAPWMAPGTGGLLVRGTL